MIIISNKQLGIYKEAASITNKIMKDLHDMVAVGISPLDIDSRADELCKKNNVISNFKGVGPSHNPYKYSTCIAVNDTVLHAIPTNVPLKKGDIVKIDFGIMYRGLNTDQCFTVVVGDFLNKEEERMVKVAKKSVHDAAKMAIAGNTVGDMGYVMEHQAHEAGFSVIREYVGHGIGKTLHDSPQIPAYGKKGQGEVLKNGMVICVESQVIVGKNDIYTDKDGWSIKTKDGSNAAMFEYMVVVGKKKPLFLTQTFDWSIVV